MNEIVNLGNGQYVKVMMLKGQQGDNIQSIAKTSTSGLVDTYTITLTDGSTQTFTVTNGKSIVSIEKTDTQGIVDTYTITFNDQTTFTYNVTNGNGIVSVSKTGSAGLVDTYTITFNDGNTETFTVTNGENGQDVGSSNLAPVELTSTASQSYLKGEHLIFNGVYYEVTQAIAQGDTISIGVNIEKAVVSDEIEKIQYLADYVTTPVKIGTWSDGRPVYRVIKSYHGTSVISTSANSRTTRDVLTLASGVDQILKVYGAIDFHNPYSSGDYANIYDLPYYAYNSTRQSTFGNDIIATIFPRYLADKRSGGSWCKIMLEMTGYSSGVSFYGYDLVIEYLGTQ